MRRRFVLPAVVLAVLGLANVPSAQAVPGSSTTPAAAAVAPAAGTYQPVTSFRALDTRAGTGVPKRALAAGATLTVPLAGHGGVPKLVSAVSVTITVLSAGKTGSVTVYPGGTPRPSAGTVSFTAARTEQSTIIAKLGTSGAVSIHNNSAGSVQLVGDVAGYYRPGTPTATGAFEAVTPRRVLDTRATSAIPAHGSRSFDPAGEPANAGSVVLNVGVLDPVKAGSVDACANGFGHTAITPLSFAARMTKQGQMTTLLGIGGRVTIYNNSAVAVTVVADVLGYYLGNPSSPIEGAFNWQPLHLLDTRKRPYPTAPNGIPSRETALVDVIGAANEFVVGDTGAVAASVTVTVVNPPRAGSVSVYPSGTARSPAATVTFAAHATTSNSIQVGLGAGGAIVIGNNTAAVVPVLVGLSGYFAGPAFPLTTSADTDLVPFHEGVVSTSCADPTLCVAVESGGYALVRRNGVWSRPTPSVLGGTTVRSVSCPVTTFCMATGSDAATYDGTTWAKPVAEDPSPITTSCASVDFCLGADYQGRYLVYDGTAWSTPHPVDGAPVFTSVSCVSSTFCVLGDAHGAVRTFDGSGMSAPVQVLSKPLADNTTEVSCAAADFCVASGTGGAAAIWDGTAFGPVQQIDPGHSVKAVSCPTATTCLAADDAGRTVAYRDGAWAAPMTLLKGESLTSVSCDNDTFCVGFSSHGDTAPTTLLGTTWHLGSQLDRKGLYENPTVPGVSCVSTVFCMAVGDDDTAFRYNGSDWLPTQLDVPVGTRLADVSCATSVFCVAVDDAGSARTYDGHRWSTAVAVDSHALATVSCGATARCAAVDVDGHVVTLGAHGWSAPRALPSAVTAVSCAGGSFCMAVANDSGTYSFNGATWSGRRSAPVQDAVSVSCTSPTFCLLSGER